MDGNFGSRQELLGPEGIPFRIHGRVVHSHLLSEDHKRNLNAINRLDFDTIENEILHREERLEKIHPQSRKEVSKWFLSLCIGIVTGGLAMLILLGTRNLSEWKFDEGRKLAKTDLLAAARFVGGVNVACATIAATLVAFVEPRAAGSGIPEVKAYLNGSRWEHLLNLRTLICKLVGITLCVSAGLMVGKEGPMVHTGVCVAAGLTRGRSKTLHCDTGMFSKFRNERDQRDFLSAGAAAGVAAAFGAPLGGILFALEEASSYWNMALTWRAFFCAMVATFTLNFCISAYQGDVGNFDQPGLIVFDAYDDRGYRMQHIPSFLLLGVLGGLLGATFNALNVRLSIWRRTYIPSSHRFRRILEVTAVAVLMSTLAVFGPYYLSSCYDADALPTEDEDFKKMLKVDGQFTCKEGEYNPLGLLLFNTQESAVKVLFSRHTSGVFHTYHLIIAFLVFFWMAILTYGISIPSGLFIPLIMIGTCYGRLAGFLSNYIFSSIDPGTYALIGAASMLGGCLRMTISLTVILLEITNDIQFLLPIMATVMVAKWVGDHFNGPLYDAYIELKHIPFLEPACPNFVSPFVTAQDIMQTPVTTLPRVVRVRDLVDVLGACQHNGFPVVLEPEGLLHQRSRRTSHKPTTDSDYLSLNPASTRATRADDEWPGSILCGLVLRSQLLALLEEKNIAPLSVIRERGIPNFLNSEAFNARHLRKIYDVVAKDFELTADEEDCFVDLRPYMHASPFIVAPLTPLSRVYRLFRSMGLRHLCVVDRKGYVTGIVTTKDLLHSTLEEKVARLNRHLAEEPAFFEKRMEMIRGDTLHRSHESPIHSTYSSFTGSR